MDNKFLKPCCNLIRIIAEYINLIIYVITRHSSEYRNGINNHSVGLMSHQEAGVSVDHTRKALATRTAKTMAKDRIAHNSIDAPIAAKPLPVLDLPLQPVEPEPTFDCLSPFYKLHETIGKGGFSVVRRATHVVTGEVVALKIIDRLSTANIELKVRNGIDQELRLLKSFNHPHICKLYQEIQTSQYIFLVQEYYSGGELFHYVQSKQRLSETETRKFFRQIASGLAYLHSNGVCHRDLKLENILLDSNLNAKLIDFGLCAVYDLNDLKDPTPLKLFCGSPAYAAPELVQSQPYIGFKSDVWALGVILYSMLNGFFPFYSPDHNKLYNSIKLGMYEEPKWLSESSKRLIRWLLQCCPKRRPTVEEILKHSWVRGGSWSSWKMSQKYQSKNYNNPGQQHLDLDVATLRKTVSFYSQSCEEMFISLINKGKVFNLNNFSSNEVSTYRILLDRHRKYGSIGDCIFGGACCLGKDMIDQSTVKPVPVSICTRRDECDGAAGGDFSEATIINQFSCNQDSFDKLRSSGNTSVTTAKDSSAPNPDQQIQNKPRSLDQNQKKVPILHKILKRFSKIKMRNSNRKDLALATNNANTGITKDQEITVTMIVQGKIGNNPNAITTVLSATLQLCNIKYIQNGFLFQAMEFPSKLDSKMNQNQNSENYYSDNNANPKSETKEACNSLRFQVEILAKEKCKYSTKNKNGRLELVWTLKDGSIERLQLIIGEIIVSLKRVGARAIVNLSDVHVFQEINK